MSGPFSALRGPIVIQAQLVGPYNFTSLRLVVDTGAEFTMLDPNLMAFAGYDLSAATSLTTVTTISGRVIAPELPVIHLTAFGQQKTAFPVIAHSLPPTAHADGLLGLDFLRGFQLTVDFRAGTITLV